MSSHNQKPSVAKKLSPFVTNCFSACFASFCIQPIDVIKTRIQVNALGQKSSFIHLSKELIKEEGVRGLYDGLSASIMRQVFYGTVRLGLHRVIVDNIKEKNNGHVKAWQTTISGLFAGAVGGLVGNPFDIAMIRMEADGLLPKESRRNYKNAFHAVYRISKDEGIMTLWRGCAPMIFRAMSVNLGMLVTYDISKQAAEKVMEPGFGANLLCSALSGVGTSVCSLPFDMIKNRLMNMKANEQGVLPYKGVIDCFIKTIKHEGFFSLWKGLVTYYCRCAPHAMIILLTNDSVFVPLYNKMFKLDN